jgi:hypothetical protein
LIVGARHSFEAVVWPLNNGGCATLIARREEQLVDGPSKPNTFACAEDLSASA